MFHTPQYPLLSELYLWSAKCTASASCRPISWTFSELIFPSSYSSLFFNLSTILFLLMLLYANNGVIIQTANSNVKSKAKIPVGNLNSR